MKNQMTKFAFMIVLSILAVSCQKKEETDKTESTVDSEQIKAEIQALENGYAEAGNAGNAEGVVTYYAEDAVSYSPNEAPQVGKAAIKAKIEEDLKSAPKGTKVMFTTNEVFPSSDGNQVVELGAYKVTDSSGTATHTGNYMALFKKVDGKYICIRDMAASDMPKKTDSK